MTNPATTTAIPRRFTILDGTVLTIVMAMAFLAARSTWPSLVFVVKAIEPTLLTDPIYIQDSLFGHPPTHLRLSSAAVLVGQTLTNTARPMSGRVQAFFVPSQGLLLVGLRRAVVVAFPVLIYLPFALLLLRVVRPRPAWTDILRQPGCSSCLAIVGSLLVATWVEIVVEIRVSVTVVAGLMAFVWIIQAATRRWQPEPSWLDRVGRALGFGWIMAGLIAAIRIG